MFSMVIAGILLLVVAYFGFFVLYLFAYSLASIVLRTTKSENRDKEEGWNSFCIIIPAHDEEKIIGRLLDSLKGIKYPQGKFEVFVIADNCSDRTEQIVREAGFKCLVRIDRDLPGKPYALDWALRRIESQDYDGFIIVDADTTVDCNMLLEFNNCLNHGHCAVQGYIKVLNPDESHLTRLMVIPGVIKYKLRYYFKNILGLSCPLMGNGMCFSRAIIQQYGWNAFSLTENWEYFAFLTMQHRRVHYAEKAVVYSITERKLKSGETQRIRWFRGKKQTTRKYFPPLLMNGIRKLDFIQIDAALEVLLPSFSMLANAMILLFMTSLGLSLVSHLFVDIAWICGCLVAMLMVVFALGMFVGRVGWRTWLAVLYVPVFLLWKCKIVLSATLLGRKKEWVKTAR